MYCLYLNVLHCAALHTLQCNTFIYNTVHAQPFIRDGGRWPQLTLACCPSSLSVPPVLDQLVMSEKLKKLVTKSQWKALTAVDGVNLMLDTKPKNFSSTLQLVNDGEKIFKGLLKLLKTSKGELRTQVKDALEIITGEDGLSAIVSRETLNLIKHEVQLEQVSSSSESESDSESDSSGTDSDSESDPKPIPSESESKVPDAMEGCEDTLDDETLGNDFYFHNS